MTLAHMSTPLLGFADATVIGRLGQPALLGAIAASAVIFDFLFWGFGFLRQGTAGMTAQAVGAGDEEEQRATLVRASLLAIALGIMLIALQRPIAAIAFVALDATPAVTEAARGYFDIRIWSATIRASELCGARRGHRPWPNRCRARATSRHQCHEHRSERRPRDGASDSGSRVPPPARCRPRCWGQPWGSRCWCG